MEKKFRNVEIGVARKIGGIFPGGNTEWNLFAWGKSCQFFGIPIVFWFFF
jgi:hypothetical protein